WRSPHVSGCHSRQRSGSAAIRLAPAGLESTGSRAIKFAIGRARGDAPMIGKWFADFVSQIKWLLLIAIVAGPGWAYYNWTELEKIKLVAAEGAEAAAVIDGGESRSRRRSGTSYTIHAIWPGEGNVQHAEDIS